MSLPWVRLDSTITQNYKILILVGDKKHRAISAYLFALAWSGHQGSDGFIPTSALPFIHATKADAAALENVMLWHSVPGGWEINDWKEYQPSNSETERRSQRAKWLNCRRWHEAHCRCSPPPPAGPPEQSIG